MQNKYLDNYIKVLPKSQAKKIDDLTNKLFSNNAVKYNMTEEHLADTINRLSTIRKRVTEFKEVNADKDLVSSMDFNNFYLPVYIDLVWLYYECYLLEQSIRSKEFLMESDIAYMKSEINNLKVKIDSLNLSAEETSFTQIYVENFNDSNIFHDDVNNLYIDRDNTILPKCDFQYFNYDRSLVLNNNVKYDICDTVPEGLQPPKIRVLDYVGMPNVKIGHEIDKAIDNSMSTFWGEFILSDEIINRKMVFPPSLKEVQIITPDDVFDEVLESADNFINKINAVLYSLDDPPLPEDLTIFGYDVNSTSNNIFKSTDFGSLWNKDSLTNIIYNDSPPPTNINSPVMSFNSINNSGSILCDIDRSYSETNQFFVYSIYIKTSDSGLTVQNKVITNSTEVYSESVEIEADNNWHRIVFVSPIIEEQIMAGFRFSFQNTGTNQKTWISAPQMEVGNTPTPFSSRQYIGLKYPIAAVIADTEADKNLILSYDYGSWYKAAFTYNPTDNSANNNGFVLTKYPVIKNYSADESYLLSFTCIIPKEYEKTIDQDYTGKVTIHTITENDIDLGFYSADKKLSSGIKKIEHITGNIYKYTVELKDPSGHDEIFLGIGVNKSIIKNQATFFYINKESLTLEKNNQFSQYTTIINEGGAICAICITLPQMMKINQISISPFAQYPISIESILGYKTANPEDELEKPEIIYTKKLNKTNENDRIRPASILEDNSGTTIWSDENSIMMSFEHSFESVDARSIVIFIKQESYTENSYTIRESTSKDIELWNIIINEEMNLSINALIEKNSNETVEQSNLDDIFGWNEYVDSLEDYRIDILNYLSDLNNYINEYGMYGEEWRPGINLPEWTASLPDIQSAISQIEEAETLAAKQQEDREVEYKNKMNEYEAKYAKYREDLYVRNNLIAYGETRSKKYDVTFVYHDSMNAFLKTSEAQRAKDLAKNYQNGGK